MFFTFCNFGNKLGMAIIFFSKMFKIWFRFQKWNNKIWKKNLVSKRSAFQSGTTNSQTPEYDNCHWQSMCYETPLRFNTSLREIFSKSGSPRGDKKTWWKCSHAYFTRVGDLLICWLSKVVLERCFLESGLTTFFTFCNFRNKVGMAIIFFFKMFKIWCRFQKWNKQIWKEISF